MVREAFARSRDSSSAWLVDEKGIAGAVDFCCGLEGKNTLHRRLKEAVCRAYEARTPCVL